MAWSDETPADWITSWSEDGTTASFDLADVSPTLSAAEADATTGDLRDILFSLIEHSYTYYSALATANVPSNMVIQKTSHTTASNTIKNIYTFTFETSISEQDVIAE